MTIEIAQVSEGTIILPLKIKNTLKGISKLLVLEQGDTIVLKKIVPPERVNLAEMAANLDKLDELAPLTSAEIAEEIHTYRAEKRAKRASSAGH